jgi:hypothetical protein
MRHAQAVCLNDVEGFPIPVYYMAEDQMTTGQAIRSEFQM